VNVFAYRNGVLHAEDVALPVVAAQTGTPTYVYSSAAISANYRSYADAFAGQKMDIHFALKANSNLGVVALLGGLGAGADIVSVGEMERALAAGIPPERIVFSGVGKTRDELAAAVAAGIRQINVESEPELTLLNDVACRLGQRQRIALRVNPDIDALTHAKISTGKRGDKFGVPYDQAADLYAKAARLSNIEAVGVAVHIGSQLTRLDPFRAAYRKISDLVRDIRRAGLTVDTIDLGGGIGVTYNDEQPPRIEDYATVVLETVGNLGCALAIEPGRSIVADAGVLLSRVIYRKSVQPHDILIVDAAMNDLMRPSLYDSYHPIAPVQEPVPGSEASLIDVVGPICESGDTFARARPLPPVDADALIIFGVAGAYGASMGSTYNARPLAAEVMVRGAEFTVVRSRQSIPDMFANERVPAWLRTQSARKLE
jgi:diaminopimelate decarboxylase